MEMALAMNLGAFEESYGNVIQGPWVSLSDEELFCVDGGRDVSVAGIICSSCAIVAGVCGVVGGVTLLLTPEPTGLTKVAGYAAITGGVATIASGVAGIYWACGY